MYNLFFIPKVKGLIYMFVCRKVKIDSMEVERDLG